MSTQTSRTNEPQYYTQSSLFATYLPTYRKSTTDQENRDVSGANFPAHQQRVHPYLLTYYRSGARQYVRRASLSDSDVRIWEKLYKRA